MFQVLSFFIYWLKKVDKHSLHSPFAFKLFTEVIQKIPEKDEHIEKLRSSLITNQEKINLEDFGAGSRVSQEQTRAIASIAKHSSTPSKFSRFLVKMIEYYDAKEILELGTSLGLNTLYMSKSSDVSVTTFEGDASIAHRAMNHFDQLGRKNIKMITGNIDETLPKHLETSRPYDLIYMDANHRFEPTLRYFELLLPRTHNTSVIVIDDIHWSKEMFKAWSEIKARHEVTLSIDLFEAGLLFFDQRLKKEDYILSF